MIEKYGVIFDASRPEDKVETSVLRGGFVCRAGARASLLESKLLRQAANSLILISLVGLFLIFAPVLGVEFSYRIKQVSRNLFSPPRSYFGELLKLPSPSQALAAPNASFSIVIPKIDASAPVLANIDASNQAEYSQALAQGVAHAKGTVFPGMKGTVYLFAHSTNSPFNIARYNAVFFLLRELEVGDEVIVFFQGKKFNYQVFEKKIVSAGDTSFFKSQGEELLVLQTCWPPGTTLKRLLVLAKPVATP